MDLLRLKRILNWLIDKIQYYTKTDMRYLLKGGFWISANQAIASVRAFILSIAFANFIPRETYGQYKYVLAIFAVLSIFTLPGIRVAITRAVAQGYEGIMPHALKTKIKYSYVASALSIIISIYFFTINNQLLGYSLIIIAVFIPFIDSFNIYTSFLSGKKNFQEMAKYQFITETIAAICLFTALLLTENLLIILIAFFLPYTLIRGILWNYTLKKFHYNTKVDHDVIPYAKHLSNINALSILAAQLDKILLMNFLGGGAVAQFSLASAVPTQMQTQVKTLQVLALPKFSEKNPEHIKNTLVLKILKSMLVLTPVVLLYILCAPYIFTFVFPKYIDAVIYSQIYSIALLFAPQMLFLTYFQAFAKKRELYIANIASPIIRIVLFVILIPFYGIYGAIISLIVERIINFNILLYLFKKS